MKKSLASRRAPKRIGATSDSESETASSIVKRPPLVSKGSKRKSTGARLSFGPSGTPSSTSANDTAEESFTPRRQIGGLGRLAAERSAQRATTDDRPSYSKDILKELASSTPSTPRAEEEVKTLSRLSDPFSGAIPTDAEIQEKKERRKRLVKEQEFISLYGEEEGAGELVVADGDAKYGETRLIREDEDVAEGFDEFVEDERIVLGRKAEKEARRAKRAEIASLIANAESSDDEENERKDVYEEAQTRAGTGRRREEKKGDDGGPREVVQVQELSSVLADMRLKLEAMKEAREQVRQSLQNLEAEKKDIEEREQWTQEQLKETARKYEGVLEMSSDRLIAQS